MSSSRFALILGLFSSLAFAQIPLSTSIPATQNFDSIGTSATATLPTGVRADKITTAVRTVGTFSAAATATTLAGGANLSSSATNGIYNFGAGTNTTGPDRAVGFLSAGTANALLSGNLYAQYANNTGGSLSGLQISYNVEKYRGGSNAAGFRIQLFYSTDGATWTNAGVSFNTNFVADAANAGFTPAPGVTVAVNQALTVSIPNGSNFYLAWNYSVSSGSTTTNAQALAIDDISVLGVAGSGQTNPSGVGAANPSSVQAGNSTLLTVAVTPGTNPTSTGLAVTADLTTIGGAATQAFFDDASHGDLVAGDNTFSFQATVPGATSAGAKSIPATITDAQSRSASASISLTVTAVSISTSPTGTGSAVLSIVAAGGTTQLTVNVTPGTNPASTGIAVTGDLSAIGGSPTQAFTGVGNSFSFLATVDAATTPGAKSLPITVSDAQARSSSFNISLTVTGPLANSTIVISQVYGGGGNANALFTNDFVQLYNRGNTTVDTSGWSLQYAPATGTGDWTGKQPLGGTIEPGQYYLIGLASGGAIGSPLPPANVNGQINMAQGAGKVALVDNGDTLTGPAGCPVSTHIKDLVGYGPTADCWEGTAAVTVSGNLTLTALFRLGAGSIDTNDNRADFTQSGPPNPFTTSPIVQLPPSVFTTDPTTNDTNVPRDATIEVSFTQSVAVDPGWFDITCATTGAHNSATEAPDGINRWITPNTNFVAGEVCTVTVFKTKVHDTATGTLSPTQDHVWSFTVATGAAPPEPPTVHLLMGSPTNAAADINQPNDYLMSKPEFALSYNRDLGRPNWVSWHLTNAWIPIAHPARVDTFRPDPAVLPDWYRVQSFDFSGSGFDRGHMTPNADREDTIPDNQATFLMSNMVAQAPDNNQGPWADFENYLRSIVRSATTNEIYIVSGPVGTTGGAGSNGPANTIAGGHVTVPSSTWKVALVLSDNGTNDDISRVNCSTTTIAVIMPNTQGIRNTPWQNFLTTVNSVETLTGYHFFTNLPQPIQNCIKAGTNGVNPKNDQTITFAPLPGKTFGDPDFSVSATASSGLAVSFSVVSGPATILGNTVHITGTGTVTVRASQPGDINYNTAADVDRSFTVATANQTITFAALPDKAFGDPDFTVSATASSGLGVTFSIASGPATVSGNMVHITGAGTVTVRASQPGDTNYNAAPNVDQPFTVAKANQTITFAPLPDKTFGDAPFTVSATGGGSSQPLTFSASGACSVSGNSVTLNGAGSCTITAAQDGDANYNPATPVARAFTINKAPQATVTVSAPTDASYGQSGLIATASGGSGNGAFSFSAGASTACSVNASSGALVITAGTGTCSVTASRAGDANYNASAPSAAASVSIHQALTTSSVISSQNPSVFGQLVTFTATVSSVAGTPAGTVTFRDGTVILGAVALNGSGQAAFPTLLLLAGNHSITAVYAADSNFAGSGSAPIGQTVLQANTSTSLTSNLNPSNSGQTVTLTATTAPVAPGSGIPTGGVTFKDGATVLATMTLNAAGQASFTTSTLALGTHSITATYSGDPNFTASTSAAVTQQVFAYLPGGGSFVIGDLDAVVGANVTFWGSQWDKDNHLSGGSAPSSFPGFASAISTNPPVVGGTWTSGSGGSAAPPDTVPDYMAVVVASTVTKDGSTIAGNVTRLVIVKTNPGYGSSPGQTGTGTVVAIIAP